MSDLVTSVEIEDVLSSIRKLVSDEPRPDESGRSAPSKPRERLVLTPDFRVPEPEKTESEDTLVLAPESAVTPEADAEPANIEDFQQSVAATEKAVADEPADAEDVTPDTSDEATVELVAAAPVFSHVKPAPIADGTSADGTDAEPLGLETRIAQLEDAVARQDDSWDPDGLDTRHQNTPEALRTPVPDVWETIDPEDIPAPSQADDVVLEAEEEPEDPAVETDETETDFAEQDVRLQADSFATEDDAMLDEEALRALVSELVRQELQGTLGARITRNVRKLVRREIHRVLDSKDFD